MTIADTLGAKVADPDDGLCPRPPSCRRPLPVPEALPPASGHSAVWRWVAAGVALAAVVAGFGVLLVTDAASAAPESVAATPAEVAGVAELFVAVHISGTTPTADRETLAPGNPGPGEPTGYWVNRAAAIAAHPLDGAGWVVTVAADMLETAEKGYEPAGVHYYQVTVATSERTPVVISGPARIPAPTPPPAPIRFSAATDTEQQMVVASFLEAYLTGRADAAGYMVAPERSAFFVEPPYATVDVVEILTDPSGALLARVVATETSGPVAHLEYLVELTLEGGLWKVAGTHSGGAIGE